MASNWSQGGQYAGAGARPYDKGSTARAYERPPTCFNCGEEGHFVVNCPRSKQSAPIGHPANLQGAAAQNSNSPLYGSQQSAYNNGTSYSAPPNTAPGTIVYPPPGQPPQQYQQFAPPPNQQYAPHSTAPQAQAPYSHYSQNLSYNGSQQPYSQPYNSPAGPPQQQYAYQGGYQAQPQAYSQYSQSPTHQQYSTPAYQPPPQPYAQSQTPYQAQPTLYQPPNGGGYEQNYNYGTPVPQNPPHPSQWSHTPPQVQPYTTPPYPSQTQYNAGYQGQYDQNGPYPPQQHQNSYATDDYEYQQSAQDSAYGADQNQQAPAYPYQVPPVEQQYVPGHPEQSMESSAASTPYASRRGSLASSQGGQECSTQNLQFSTQRTSNSLSEEDQQFNWDFKKIFKEDSHQEALPINRPLPNAFEDDTSPLYSNYPSDSASQYASKSREKEFKQSIRQSYHWPSMQQDPVFSDIKYGAPLIPLDQLSSWMEERHDSLALTDTSNDHRHSDGSRKRTWSDEQADVDNQISQEAFAEYKASSPSIKRQKTDALPRITTSYGNEESANTGPGTPVFARAGTPSFGAEDDVWAPQAGESQDPTEAKLAALGVSGAPKPVQPMDPVPLPPDFNSHLGYNLPPRRQDSGYVSANGSYNNIPQPSQYNGYQPNYDSQWQSQPPPPPPPPPPQENPPRKPDRPSSTLLPQDETQDNAQSQPSNGVQHNGTSTTPTPVDIVSPQVPQPRRKIVRVISGKKTEPLRQEDDVTPKFKRSQPVVAEAYGRRW